MPADETHPTPTTGGEPLSISKETLADLDVPNDSAGDVRGGAFAAATDACVAKENSQQCIATYNALCTGAVCNMRY